MKTHFEKANDCPPYFRSCGVAHKRLKDDFTMQVMYNGISVLRLTEADFDGLIEITRDEFDNEFHRVLGLLMTEFHTQVTSRITFQKFLAERNKRLSPWQERAANALLLEMRDRQDTATGKTWLLSQLTDFIETHGNEFRVE